uniref:Sodium channel toxin NaTx6 n=1 Tax=Odontobuthus doriae TaxID=342590 RepID=A0A0U4QNN2_ODODO|nr:sodium channel toxin NaTx6 [Odontobuthus doriae]
MKLIFLLIISASMVIEGLANSDGYLKGGDGCKITCMLSNKCDGMCKIYGGSSGSCSGIACWCKNIPEKHIWKPETNTCGGKKMILTVIII